MNDEVKEIFIAETIKKHTWEFLDNLDIIRGLKKDIEMTIARVVTETLDFLTEEAKT